MEREHARDFLMSQACIPYLKQADNPHILTLSPPLNLDAKWFAPHRLTPFQNTA